MMMMICDEMKFHTSIRQMYVVPYEKIQRYTSILFGKVDRFLHSYIFLINNSGYICNHKQGKIE
jgi:hypothetical protein